MDVYLDPKETELVMGLLEHRLEGLQREIHHTDSRSFKAELKAEEALAQEVLAKLKTPAAMGI
ncbi:hypothetical protein [Geothrix sp.]|jgi:hypothetical protein|uniref:hypothetical protein n=1 Tax=Geothrix sp. TaxID=1962974 RepID=UPI0025BA14E1|nr:hypothetical protein [Geothrix sp.]